MPTTLGRSPFTVSEALQRFLCESKAKRKADADWWWTYECERVLAAIRFAADPQTKSFYGYYGRPEIEAVRMVRQLVKRGRLEGRIERAG